jgi:diacylglycerol O-acyltransferase / wax synthase
VEKLSGLDAAFLHMETSSNHMHVASAAVYDPSTMENGYTFERMKAIIDSRLHLVPLFRRRIVDVPLGLDHPVWIEDPDFDLDYHVRRAALPSPGGIEELAAFAADVFSRQLDRRRPLWVMWVVEGLEDGHIALIAKTHHAAVDGMTGVDLLHVLLDTEPHGVTEVDGEDDWEPEEPPSNLRMLRHAAGQLARRPWRFARTASQTALAAGRLAAKQALPDEGVRGLIPFAGGDDGDEEERGERDASGQLRKDPPPAPFTAPRTPFNQAITSTRVAAFTSFPLDDVKAVKDAFDVKVNDVVLAVCGTSLRRYLEERGELPDQPLVAFVPISVRTEDDDGQMGNQVSATLTSLATDTDDPVERLERLSSGMKSAKKQHETIGATTLIDWAEFAAPAVANQAARVYSNMRLAERHRPLHNVVISNVPGPQRTLYLADAKLVAMYPMGPVIDGGALNITVMSYQGEVFVGVVGDRNAVTTIHRIADGIGDGLEELLKAADERAA